MNHLLTSGCSFSESSNSAWPTWLARYWTVPLTNVALGSQGNGLISRRLLSALDLLLEQGLQPRVCVMWSGWSRTETMSLSGPYYRDCLRENPTTAGHDPVWRIHNPHFDDAASVQVYRALPDEHLIYVSLEHVLRTQWRLQQLGVDYLFMLYKGDALPAADLVTGDHQGLLAQFDWSRWITDPMWEWCRTHSGIAMPRADVDDHPRPPHHRQWAESVVAPWFLSTQR